MGDYAPYSLDLQIHIFRRISIWLSIGMKNCKTKKKCLKAEQKEKEFASNANDTPYHELNINLKLTDDLHDL